MLLSAIFNATNRRFIKVHGQFNWRRIIIYYNNIHFFISTKWCDRTRMSKHVHSNFLRKVNRFFIFIFYYFIFLFKWSRISFTVKTIDAGNQVKIKVISFQNKKNPKDLGNYNNYIDRYSNYGNGKITIL